MHPTAERDERIDVLRFIGLAMIILAHVGPPGFILQLRNFDVPLMVLVSGMSYELSAKNEPWMQYAWKRIKRLVFPVWIFLACYFVAIEGFGLQGPKLDFELMTSSFLLDDGIGYVWVIRVFLLMAFLAPFLMRFSFYWSRQNAVLLFVTTTLVYAAYEVIVFSSGQLDYPLKKIFQNIILYSIPYSIIFLIGLKMRMLDRKYLVFMTFLSLFVFIIIALILVKIQGKFIPTQVYKYPPQLYYISYSIFVSCILWINSRFILELIKLVRAKKIVMFVAQNSIWIYLWHIPFVEALNLNYLAKYLFVFFAAALITALQFYIVRKMLPRIIPVSWQRNANLIFTG